MQAKVTNPDQRWIVREYTSSRAFHKDARDLYASAGYTVMSTSAMPHRGIRLLLSFLGQSHDHLVITYAPPTNHKQTSGDVR